MRVEQHNLDGLGHKRVQVYDMEPVSSHFGFPLHPRNDFWAAVTNALCPAPGCTGQVRWAEADHVPGYRICDACGRHFLAKGTADKPMLLRVGTRRSQPA